MRNKDGVEEIEPHEDLVTPERLAKGDLEVAVNLRGKVSRAIPSQLTILKYLIAKGIFPYYYEVYGVGFLELRHAYLAPWKIRGSRFSFEHFGLEVAVGKALEIYQRVANRLTTPGIAVIQHAMESNQDRYNKNVLSLYRDQFEKLITFMDEEKEKLRES